MKLTLTNSLIKNHLHNLEAAIKQHKYCIENEIHVDYYKDSLVNLEERYSELNKEYELIKSI